jgi:hypothetical protein
MQKTTKKEIISMIKTTLNSIDDYSDIVDGIDIKNPILSYEKDLITFLNYLEQKGTRLNREKKQAIKILIDDIVEIIENDVKKHFKNSNNDSILIQKVQEKAKSNYGFYTIKSPLNDSEKIKIAKIPFLIWACGDTPYQNGFEKGEIIWKIREKLIDIWGETISYSGEKLTNDNKYHSEWIRSMGVLPTDFYDLVKDKEWINDFAFNFCIDFTDNEILRKDFNLKDFLNEITNIDENINERFQMTKSLYKKSLKIDNNILQSLPYNINSNSYFPIYFHPLKENEGTLENFIKTTCVIVENSDESINEIALEFSDYNNSIIFTRNASKTAHLINISKDLNLNIFHLPSNVELEYNKIYKLEKDGKITIVGIDEDFNIPGIPLQNCENEVNFYDENLSKKVSNLSKCYNQGINVPNGFFKIGSKPIKLVSNIEMIARSAGSTENGSKASFSGIFKSKKLDINSIDNNKLNILEVINSFKSPIAKKYSQKMNVNLPIVGVFYQEYINADNAYVVKMNDNNLYIEMINGSTDGLVNGTAKNIKVFELNDINQQIIDNINDLGSIIKDNKTLTTINSNLIKMIFNVSKILNKQKLEFEIVEKENIFYLIQVI